MFAFSKPVIGIISCNRSVEGEAAYTVKSRYVDAVWRYADAVPLICPSMSDASDASAIVARLDAILLTGSNSNIEPRRYGETNGRAPFDLDRDAMSAALIAAAMEASKPVFGICRGLQEINVALGGTLKDQRDGPTEGFQHHAPDGVDLETMFAHGHMARPIPGTVMERIVGGKEIAINSIHYQAIDRLAPALMATVAAEDGVVEAVSSRPGETPILAVQWHPEWKPDERKHDLAFWEHVGTITRQTMVR